MNVEMQSVLASADRISNELGPLSYGASLGGINFYYIYECWPWEVNEIFSSKSENTRRQYFYMLEEGYANVCAKWGARWPDLVEVFMRGERVYCSLHANQYPIEIEWPDGCVFSLIDGFEYLYYFVVWVRRLFLVNDGDVEYVRSGVCSIFYCNNFSEFLSCIDNVVPFLSVSQADFVLMCLSYIKENTNVDGYFYSGTGPSFEENECCKIQGGSEYRISLNNAIDKISRICH